MDKRSRETESQRLDATHKQTSSSNRGGRIGDFATLQYQLAAQKPQETERQRTKKGKALAPPDRKNRSTGRTISDAHTSAEKQAVLSNAHHRKKGHSGIYGSGLDNGCVVSAVHMMLHDQGVYKSNNTVAQEVGYDPSAGASSSRMPEVLNRYGNISYEYVSDMDTTQLQEALEHGPVGGGFRRPNGNLHEVVIDRVTSNVHYRDASGYYATPKEEWDSSKAGGYIAPE